MYFTGRQEIMYIRYVVYIWGQVNGSFIIIFFSHLHPPFPEVFAYLCSTVSIGADPLRVPFTVSLLGHLVPVLPVSCLIGGSRVPC